MLVNRSNVGGEGGGRAYRPYFWEGRGWLFFFMEAHCAPLRKQHTHLVLASRPHHVSRAVTPGVSLIFSCPSLPPGKSLAVTQFTFSKFTLCQKYPFQMCIPSKFTLDVSVLVLQGIVKRGKREGVRCIYGKWPEKNIWYSLLFFHVALKIVFQIVIKNARLSILVTKYI